MRIQRLFATIVLLMFVTSATASGPNGTNSDPSGDQTTHGTIGIAFDCVDPRTDLVQTFAGIAGPDLLLSVTVFDLAGNATCGPMAFDADSRFVYIHSYFDWWSSEEGAYGKNNAYVFVSYDVQSGSATASVTQFKEGSFRGSTIPIHVAGIDGNTISFELPAAGSFEDDGETWRYKLQRSFSYYANSQADFPTFFLRDTTF